MHPVPLLVIIIIIITIFLLSNTKTHLRDSYCCFGCIKTIMIIWCTQISIVRKNFFFKKNLQIFMIVICLKRKRPHYINHHHHHHERKGTTIDLNQWKYNFLFSNRILDLNSYNFEKNNRFGQFRLIRIGYTGHHYWFNNLNINDSKKTLNN